MEMGHMGKMYQRLVTKGFQTGVSVDRFWENSLKY